MRVTGKMFHTTPKVYGEHRAQIIKQQSLRPLGFQPGTARESNQREKALRISEDKARGSHRINLKEIQLRDFPVLRITQSRDF